ncbi:FecR family protein [Zobellia uliginosa]|uniref:FecR family protein n=1 Tax=Zobellia uliginosa TaxID=143224 RepID=UPI001C06ADE2|nr:FecR family protein [Zobellia uliginosa]MBU2947360.1 DUF4974 domain-containing protein [Zobellia uliginosa]
MDINKISKYLNNTASTKEVMDVERWIDNSSENLEKFLKFKAQHIISSHDETAKIADFSKGFKQFKINIGVNFPSKRKEIWNTSLKYAAMLVLGLGFAYAYYQGIFYKEENIDLQKNAITLKLENGKVKVINEDGTTSITDSKGNSIGTQRGTSLIYEDVAVSEKLNYNTLTVPYGKRFDILLSDSTHVFLNAGSSLKYPVNFINEKNRVVHLTGEAFFVVAKDAEHPFIVNVDKLNIRVLGTKFNVSAYPEDNTCNTMLAEGSVGVYKGNSYNLAKTTFLTPGHMATLNKTNDSISVQPAETSLHTAWMTGNIIFRHSPFKNIITKLERQYNVKIINQNKLLEEELFTANFKNPSLNQILETFKENYDIDYKIDQDKIIIKP